MPELFLTKVPILKFHTHAFACCSLSTTNCMYFTLLPTIFQIIPKFLDLFGSSVKKKSICRDLTLAADRSLSTFLRGPSTNRVEAVFLLLGFYYYWQFLWSKAGVDPGGVSLQEDVLTYERIFSHDLGLLVSRFVFGSKFRWTPSKPTRRFSSLLLFLSFFNKNS